MKSAKIIVMVLAAALAMGGCSSKENTVPTPTTGSADSSIPAYMNAKGMPIVNKPMSLKIMVNNSSTQPDFGNVEMWKAYEKQSGVKIDWVNIPAGTANEKLNMAFASGELPDAFLKFTVSNINQQKFGKDGMILNLKKGDLLEKYATNFNKYMKEHSLVSGALTFPDGAMYSFPQAIESIPNKVAGKMFLNKTWMDKLGLKMPETTDDLYNILKAFKTKDPNGNNKADEIAFSSPNFNYILYGIQGAFGLGNRGVHETLVDANPSTGKARILAAAPEWKQMLEYLKKLYDEGLLDNDIFTMKDAQYTAKAAENLIGTLVYTNLSNIPESTAKNFTGLTKALKGPNGDQIWFPVRSDLHSTGAFVITSACKTPELALRWVDHFYSEEGILLYNYGVEGTSHVKNADGTYSFVKSVYDSIKGNVTFDAAVAPHVTVGGNNPIIVKEKYFYGGETAPVPAAAAHAMEPYFPKTIWPMFTFTEAENNEISVIRTDINNYVTKMRAEFVTGKTPLTEWNNYVKQIETMGGSKLCAIYDAACARANVK